MSTYDCVNIDAKHQIFGKFENGVFTPLALYELRDCIFWHFVTKLD